VEAGDVDVCRKAGNGHNILFLTELGRLVYLFTPRVSDSYYYRTVLGDGDQRTGQPC